MQTLGGRAAARGRGGFQQGGRKIVLQGILFLITSRLTTSAVKRF